LVLQPIIPKFQLFIHASQKTISLVARLKELFSNKITWHITTCVGNKIRAQEFMILRSKDRNNSTLADKIRFSSLRYQIAKI